MPSFSATLKLEAARQKADDCAQLVPMRLPGTVVNALGSLPSLPVDPVAREAAIAALPIEQRALIDWFNQDVAETENHQTYCKEET
jgi:hypothetical protein